MPEIARQRRERISATRALIAAVQADNIEDAAALLTEKLCPLGELDASFRQIARSNVVAGERFRAGFLELYMTCGDSLRSEVNDDLALLNVLRLFLPPYSGPSMRLFRGQGTLSNRSRAYGISWSETKAVAEDYARNRLWSYGQHGSVLLETVAPADAIICSACASTDDRYCEMEFIVDRRRLVKVDVLAHYPADTTRRVI